MELVLKKETVAYCGCVFEKSIKQTLDLGWNLPDYCTDIRRILQCTVTPCIGGVSVSGARLSAAGEVQVRLVYLNERGALDCFYETAELSAAVEAGSACDDAQVLALAAVDYVNARAASPRRFTLSGAVSVLFRAFRRKTQTLLCGIENCGGQTKCADVPCLSLLSCAEKTFDLSETVELPEGAKPVEKLLRATGTLRLDSQKAVSGKLLLRGELAVTLLYLTDGDGQQLLHYEHRMPISQIIEVPDVTEDALCETTLHLQCLRVLTRADSAGALRLFDVTSQISAFIKAFEKKTQPVVTDCYATRLALCAKTQEVPFCDHLQTLDRTLQVQTVPELGDLQVKAAADVWAECGRCSVQNGVGGFAVTGEATVHLLLELEDGGFAYAERSVTISEPLSLSADEADVTGTLSTAVCAATAQVRADGTVLVTLDCRVQGELYAVKTRTVCVDAFADENADARRRSALTLYFAQPGETLWDIAKHYRTSVDAIQIENGLDDDTVIAARMLMVPMS